MTCACYAQPALRKLYGSERCSLARNRMPAVGAGCAQRSAPDSCALRGARKMRRQDRCSRAQTRFRAPAAAPAIPVRFAAPAAKSVPAAGAALCRLAAAAGSGRARCPNTPEGPARCIAPAESGASTLSDAAKSTSMNMQLSPPSPRWNKARHCASVVALPAPSALPAAQP